MVRPLWASVATLVVGVFLVEGCDGGAGDPFDGSMPDTDRPVVDAEPLIDMEMVAPFCDADDPTLVGCWELEQNANDASGDGNHATATNVTYAAGKVGQAVVLAANSTLVVVNPATLGPPRLSFEAWIRPSQTPPSAGRWGVIDSNAYGVFITATTITCGMNGTLTITAAIPANVWTHLACSSDGATVRLYLDGIPSGTTNGAPLLVPSTAIVLGGNEPSGDHFLGSIDQLRLFNVARSQEQICAATDLATCK